MLRILSLHKYRFASAILIILGFSAAYVLLSPLYWAHRAQKGGLLKSKAYTLAKVIEAKNKAYPLRREAIAIYDRHFHEETIENEDSFMKAVYEIHFLFEGALEKPFSLSSAYGINDIFVRSIRQYLSEKILINSHNQYVIMTMINAHIRSILGASKKEISEYITFYVNLHAPVDNTSDPFAKLIYLMMEKDGRLKRFKDTKLLAYGLRAYEDIEDLAQEDEFMRLRYYPKNPLELNDMDSIWIVNDILSCTRHSLEALRELRKEMLMAYFDSKNSIQTE